MTSDLFDRRFASWLFCAALAFSAWAISVGWNNGFLPGNEFRQTHTAITALFIDRESNFSLAYPTPLLGKPWSIPYEFPLYQWTVVAVHRATGLGLTPSARAVSATCFYLTLPALALLLARLGLTRPRRLLVLAAVLTCPLYLFYARAFLIEMMALMFSLWFLAAFLRAVEGRSLAWLALANLAGAGAGLVKVTTFLLYLLPAACWSLAWLWTSLRAAEPAEPGASALAVRRPFFVTLGWIAAATAVPFAATLWWIHHADAIKALNLSGRLLMSDAMSSYHFGTWQTRLSPALWQTFWHTLVTHLTPVPTLLALGALAVLVGGRWRKWILGCTLVFAAGPLVFPLLYSWHEYYFSANGVLLMVALGLALCGAVEATRFRGLAWSVVLAVFAFQAGTYLTGFYPGQAQPLPGGSGLTRLLHDATQPDDVMIIAGDDWAPMIPYYSQRRALMLRRGMDWDGSYLPAAFRSMQGEPVTVLLLRGDARRNQALCQRANEAFGLGLEPIARWEDVLVYVRPDRRAQFIRQSRERNYDGAVLVGPALAESLAFESVEKKTADLPPGERGLFEGFSPQPVRFASRYGIGRTGLSYRTVVMAHPNARLVFAPPPGRRQVSAEFGLMPAAYEAVPPGEAAPEGATFSIRRLRRDGTSELLFERFIDPVGRPADRGTQRLALSVALQPGDELAFITGPGPRGTFNRAWAYWAGARIR